MKQIMFLTFLMSGATSYALYADQLPTDGVSPAAQTQTTEWNHIQGVDTAGDEGRGDWFKKKQLVQQARTVYQQLHATVEQISQTHDTAEKLYAPKIAEHATSLAALEIQPHIVEQKLEALSSSIELLAAKEKLSDAERKELIEQQDSKTLLQQLLEDLTFATELEKGLQEGVTIAQTQVEQCKIYEQKAWNLYEAIDAALNDTIAEQKLEEMQTIAENIGLIGNYLSADLQGYFDKNLPLLHEQEQKLLQQYQALQARGILEKKKNAQEIAEENKPEAKTHEQASWWRLLLSPFIWVWNWIMSLFA